MKAMILVGGGRRRAVENIGLLIAISLACVSGLGAPKPAAADVLARLPLSFEANQGQFNPDVQFLAHAERYDVLLTSGAAMLRFRDGRSVRIGLHGSSAQPRPHSETLFSGTSNYFLGNDPKGWRTHIPTYGKVRYEGVYPGVDLVYYGRGRELEYDFAVAPGADPRNIRLAIDGAHGLAIATDGDLVIDTAGGPLRWRKPNAYQIVNGIQRKIAAAYRLGANGEVEVRLGRYDRSLKLVIDPELVFATYLGGVDSDRVYGIAVDAEGNTYIAGQTDSSNFLVAPGLRFPAQHSVFVAKLNPTGSALLYAAIFGGNSAAFGATGQNVPAAIAVDPFGNAYVTGTTDSIDFPTVNAAQPVKGVGDDAFVVKLNPTGSELLYSTYIGGDSLDDSAAIAVNSSGESVITGMTYSMHFPTVKALQPALADSGHTLTPGDAFVTKLSADGAFVYSTYLGGPGGDRGTGIALDAAGNAYVTGYAEPGFPTTNALKATSSSGNAFVAKLDPAGSKLSYSTFLGGSGLDRLHQSASDVGQGIAVDVSGNAYVTGTAGSSDFPVVGGPPSPSGYGRLAFLSKLNSEGSALIYSTVLGSDSPNSLEGTSGWSIAVNGEGAAFVAGATRALNFPAVNPLRLPSGSDIFLAKFNPEGSALEFTTFFPGSDFFTGSTVGPTLAVDQSGSAYLAYSVDTFDGATLETTSGAFQTSFGGFRDVYMVKIADRAGTQNPFPLLTSIFPPNAKAASSGFTLIVTGANFVNGSTVLWNGIPRTTVFVSNTELHASISSQDISTGGFGQVAVFTPAPGGGVSNILPFRIENPVPSPGSITMGVDSGSGTFSLQVSGSNFARGAVVWANGVALDTGGFDTTLLASLPIKNLANQVRLQISVTNPGPAGGSSGTLSLELSPPRIDSVTPNRVFQSDIMPTLTVRGSNFTPTTQLLLNGRVESTTFVNSTEIAVQPPRSTGVDQLTAWNSTPLYGLSNTVSATVIGEAQTFSTASWSGTYIFSMDGYISNGSLTVPVAIAGRLVVDGKGKITSGTMDYLDPVGPIHSDLAGTYHIDQSGLGEGHVETSLRTFVFEFTVLNGSRGTVRLSTSLGSGLTAITSGEVEKQDSGDISASGDYVFSLQGITVRGWMSSAGRLAINDSGRTVAGVEDRNDTGQTLTNSPLGGTFTLDAAGRGTAVLAGAGGSSHLVFYVVSRNKLKTISTDPTAIVSGEAERQELGPFSNASLRGYYGFLLEGFSASTWDASLARFTADGEGGVSGGLVDLNSSGTVTEDVPFSGTYEVSSNGRGRLTLDAWPGSMQGTFYLVSREKAKFVQLSPTSALGGVLEIQQPLTFSATSLSEAFGFSLAGFADNQPATYWGDFLTDGIGTTAGRDFSPLGSGPTGARSSGTYTISPDGRGIIRETSGAGMPRKAFVALTPSKLMMITLDSSSMTGYAEGQARLTQKINNGGIVNSADLREGGGGGTIMTLFGNNLAPVTAVAESLPLPTMIAGVQVFVSGVAAPLYFVSPQQIDFEIPWNTFVGEGVVVAIGDERSLPQFPSIQRDPAPAIFTLNHSGGGQGAIVVASSGEVAAPLGSVSARGARPARPGELVSIYCTGLGPVNNPPPSGSAASTEHLSMTPSTPLVSIGNRAAWVTFSGLVPGFVGLYQINAQVPYDVSPSDAAPVLIEMPTSLGYASSNMATIAVRP